VNPPLLQVKYLLGMGKVLNQVSLPMLFLKIPYNWRSINPFTVVCSVLCIAMMISLKSVNQKYFPKFIIPEQLVVAVVFTSVSAALSLSSAPYSIECLGSLVTSLPAFEVPHFAMTTVRLLIRPALITAIISYMVTISIVQSFAAKHQYRVDPTQVPLPYITNPER
jgi:MFS superfamily sulfate permease-like transporter